MTVLLKSSGRSSPKTLRSTLRILRATTLWSMATTSPSGRSHINTAYFCFDEQLRFYFISDRRSQHARNVLRVSQVAVAVFESEQAWGADHRGLQLFGHCRRARRDEAPLALAAYSRRFPAYAEYLSTQSPTALRRSPFVFFTFTPRRLKVLDETVFGEEIFVGARIVRSE